MQDPANSVSLICEIDALHDDVLRQLDDLNHQIERTLNDHSQKSKSDKTQIPV